MFRKTVFTMMVAVLLSAVSFGPVYAGQGKVTVCHKPGTAAEATLEVSANAESAHLGHGDYAGECQGPQSAGCDALNAIVPDPHTGLFFYDFAVSDLDFFPGETIHVDLTVTSLDVEEYYYQLASISVRNSANVGLVNQQVYVEPQQQATLSIDYVVVAGDDADGAAIAVLLGGEIGFTVDSASMSCTPA